MSIHRKLKAGLLLAALIGTVAFVAGFFGIVKAQHPGHLAFALWINLLAMCCVGLLFRRVRRDERRTVADHIYR